MEQATNSYEQERRQKLARLREMGIDPYGGRVEGVQALADVRALFKPEMGQDGGPVVKAAGRVMLYRDMGKLTFMTLRDETGDLQVAVDKRRVDEQSWEVRGLIDLGDQVIVEGPVGVTKKGEVTVWATKVGMAAKALLPPPAKHEGLQDVELRYRQRYVDLWANPDVMRVLTLRSAVVAEIRRYMTDRGYLEVETPMMQALAGGAAARPFTTHHNALDLYLYLRIAPELYLKRLLVGGYRKVFELNRNFRNEGISPRHNPEFTMLEAYEAFGSWETMADLVEGMVCHVAEKLFGGLKIEHKNAAREVTKTINLSRPWRRVKLVDLVEERTGWRFRKAKIQEQKDAPIDRIVGALADRSSGFVQQASPPSVAGETDLLAALIPQREALLENARVREREYLFSLSDAEQLQHVYEKLIEPTLIDPTFVMHVPSVVIPLARKWKEDEYFADVYELAINGQEISPGYSELNDPDVQAANFAHQVGDKEEQQKVDEDFLNALRYGMPPAGGMGLGIDRLVMMLTGAESIRDVILFPLMRPSQTG
ncbi:MAG TPA: amino acid--tRNA ligase-related protein [Tepidisphaeraceae bacterium]|jgi:lysyl-tRNA synthetase class 2|nr:amino acid--tRNA ligase-related protein [Tepidisphaeraceae bacterium]